MNQKPTDREIEIARTLLKLQLRFDRWDDRVRKTGIELHVPILANLDLVIVIVETLLARKTRDEFERDAYTHLYFEIARGKNDPEKFVELVLHPALIPETWSSTEEMLRKIYPTT